MENRYKTFDVILVDFGEVEFAGEQGGERPAVIIQNAMGNKYSSTTIVLPFTSKIKNINQPTHSLFRSDIKSGLSKDSMILGECVRQISEKRIIKKLGSIQDLKDKLKIKQVYDANFGEVI